MGTILKGTLTIHHRVDFTADMVVVEIITGCKRDKNRSRTMRRTETGTGKVYQNIINEITVPRLQIKYSHLLNESLQ